MAQSASEGRRNLRRPRRDREHSCERLDHLVVGIFERIVHGFDEPLHRQEPEGCEIGEEREQARLDPGAIAAIGLLRGELVRRPGQDEVVQRPDARELLRVETDRSGPASWLCRNARRKSSSRGA